jgi:chromosome partitioning protein
MRTVVFSCLKGGSGKTTHSAHFAVTLEAIGKGPVVTIDLDPQGSFADWWNARAADTPAFAKLESVSELGDKHAQLGDAGFAWCVIDTPPASGSVNEAAIFLADIVVIPVKPSPHDLRAAAHTVELCERAGKKFFFLLNEVSGKAVATGAITALAALGPIVPQSVSKLNGYSQSMIDGRTFAELTPKGGGADAITAVTNFLVGQFEKPVRKEKAHV